MPLSLKIALKHLLNRRRQTIMSLLGVMLGVAFFMAVSAMMRGSERDFIERLINSAPHITIRDEYREPPTQPAVRHYPGGAVEVRRVKPRTEVRGIRGYKQKLDYTLGLPGVRAAPVLSGQVILTFAGKEQGVLLNGVVPNLMVGVSDIEEKITVGSLSLLSANPNGLIIGEALAEKLNLEIGDNVSVASPTGLIRVMKVVGLFRTGATAVDEGQAYGILKRAQLLLGRPDRANLIVIQLDDPYSAREVAAQIERRVGYRAESWQEASEDITALLFIRNLIMYSVVSIILVVASFGIYNVISTVVMEKRRDIGILKSMGFTVSDIRRIFLFEGTVVGAIGSLLGGSLGIALMAGLGEIQLKPPGVTETVYLPLYWGFDQFALACAFATLSAMGAAYFPARKAGDLQPVEILRGLT